MCCIILALNRLIDGKINNIYYFYENYHNNIYYFYKDTHESQKAFFSTGNRIVCATRC